MCGSLPQRPAVKVASLCSLLMHLYVSSIASCRLDNHRGNMFSFTLSQFFEFFYILCTRFSEPFFMKTSIQNQLVVTDVPTLF